MMLLTSTRCALIACRYLAKGYSVGQYISAPEIAQHYKMNVRALLPALHTLTLQGILRSRRGGIGSGFMFARSPKEISIWDIVSALEGDLTLPCCKSFIQVECDCGGIEFCKINSTINKGFLRIKEDLQKINVHSLV